MVLVQTTLEGAKLEIEKLEYSVKSAQDTVGELNRALRIYISLARRTGLPENIVDAIARMEQAIITARTLQTSITTLYTATGPLGYLIGAGGLALTGFMIFDQLERDRRGSQW